MLDMAHSSRPPFKNKTSINFVYIWCDIPTGVFMNTQQFIEQLDARIAKYDLLCHPFYKAWAAGELTKADLREYAQDYYHHVESFPTYLAELGMRLEEGETRRAVHFQHV